MHRSRLLSFNSSHLRPRDSRALSQKRLLVPRGHSFLLPTMFQFAGLLLRTKSEEKFIPATISFINVNSRNTSLSLASSALSGPRLCSFQIHNSSLRLLAW